MELVLQPPAPFCFEKDLHSITSGNLSSEWMRWKKSFLIYHKACQLHALSKEVQISILLHVIGEQCRDVYEQFTPVQDESSEQLLERFSAFFTPKKNITFERHKFFTRSQQNHESIEQYTFELNKLALQCEFKELKDELVKDMLICGIKNVALRERLLREPDLSLIKALDICNVAERSRVQAVQMKMEQDRDINVHAVEERDSETSDLECEVHWVNNRNTRRCGCAAAGRRSGGWPSGGARPSLPGVASAGTSAGARGQREWPPTADRTPPPPPPPPRGRIGNAVSGNQQVRENACNYCGMRHEKYACPAYGQRCAKCRKLNHYARVCRVYAVQDNSTDQVSEFSSINNSLSDEWYVELQIINAGKIKFKLDTGAEVNVLPFKYLSRTGFREGDLSPTSTTLVSYSGDSIKVAGKCSLKVLYKNTQYILNFIIVHVNSPPILGKTSCQEMNLVKRIFTIGVENEKNNVGLLNDFRDVFEGMGCLPGVYKIRLSSDARPVVHAPRKLPVALRDDVKRKLDEMLAQGVIAKVEGPTDWVNSITVVKKASGDIRICLDPRDLNKYIKREHFKLPTLDEITSKLSGAKFFSTLDCKQSFWQTKLHNDSTDLCTFNTVFGRYKFLRMPFGISSASEIFHKKLYECVDDIEGVELFVDDLLIHGSTKNEHDKRLRQVLERCRQINIKLNRDKCKIGLTEIKYLGHIISASGIRPDNVHILPILEMPKPQNSKDLERFLGLITYVGNFVPHLSEKTHKLRELLRKEISWHWDEIHDRCFEELKRCITNPPVLQYYSLEKPVLISVDASKNGLGACLMQSSLPVCFASKSLTKTEQAYAQIEKELYACVFACEKFYTYIYGRSDIVIETDHKPLISIINKPIVNAPPRLQRMLMRLQPFTFKLVYKPGKYLYVADTLSRAVAPSGAAVSATADYLNNDELDARAQVCAVAVSNPLTDTHFIELQKYTKEDTELQALIDTISSGWPLEKYSIPDLVKPYWDCRDELSVAYDLVWRGHKIIIPNKMRHSILKQLHIGHLGAAKTKLRAREIVYWPNINTQIQDMITHCQACLTHRKENSKQPLISHEIPNRAWSKLGLDLFHFQGGSYLLVIDYFSKFIEVEKLQNLTSYTVIDKLKIIFSRQGIPNTIMSDNGPEFSSKIFYDFCNTWKINHITSSPKYPQSNGQAERAIQTIKQMLKKTYYDRSDFRLALLEFLNTPINDSLPSPTELLNNRKLRSIVPCSPDLLKPKIQNTKQIHNSLLDRQKIQKTYFDRGSKNLIPLQIDDKIKVRLNDTWVSGTVIGILGYRSYTIKLLDGRTLRRNRRHIIKDSCLQTQNEQNQQFYNYYDDYSATVNESQLTPASASSSVPSTYPPPSSQLSLSSQQHIHHSPNYTNSNSNEYITRFGRSVRPPDRWGYPDTRL